jgi:hypothetical protein
MLETHITYSCILHKKLPLHSQHLQKKLALARHVNASLSEVTISEIHVVILIHRPQPTSKQQNLINGSQGSE